ncbi:MAG: hypothetical protein ABJD53_02055 [Gammaproteobacteria bacterium]
MQDNDKLVANSLAPLAGSGGVVALARSEREPYETLDDLMSVVEALCRIWPLRGTFRDTGKFLL